MRECPFSLGAYKAEESLLHSGAGVLYRGRSGSWQGGPAHYVGLFLLDAEMAKDGVLLSRYREGIERSSGLSHPNLMQVLEFGSGGKDTFLVTDWIPGRPLERFSGHLRSRGRPWPVAHSICIGIEVAKALAFLHSYRDPVAGGLLQLPHCYVRPKGIMLTYGGAVKLVPLPLAWAEAHGERLHPPEVFYSAPEQALGWEVDSRSDLFSLGVVLWELLAGAQLFSAPDAEERKKQLFEMPLDPPSARTPDVPAELDKIVMRLMDRDPYLRYQVADEVVRDLSAVLKFRFGSASLGELAVFCQEEFKELREADMSVMERAASSGGETQVLDLGKEAKPLDSFSRAPAVKAAATGPRPGTNPGINGFKQGTNPGLRQASHPGAEVSRGHGSLPITVEASAPSPRGGLPAPSSWPQAQIVHDDVSWLKYVAMGLGAFALIALLALGLKKKMLLGKPGTRLASVGFSGSGSGKTRTRKALLWTSERDFLVEVNGKEVEASEAGEVNVPEGVDPPMGVMVPVGVPVTIRVRKEGYEDFIIQRTFAGDQDFQLDVDLRKAVLGHP